MRLACMISPYFLIGSSIQTTNRGLGSALPGYANSPPKGAAAGRGEDGSERARPHLCAPVNYLLLPGITFSFMPFHTSEFRIYFSSL